MYLFIGTTAEHAASLSRQPGGDIVVIVCTAPHVGFSHRRNIGSNGGLLFNKRTRDP